MLRQIDQRYIPLLKADSFFQLTQAYSVSHLSIFAFSSSFNCIHFFLSFFPVANCQRYTHVSCTCGEGSSERYAIVLVYSFIDFMEYDQPWYVYNMFYKSSSSLQYLDWDCGKTHLYYCHIKQNGYCTFKVPIVNLQSLFPWIIFIGSLTSC